MEGKSARTLVEGCLKRPRDAMAALQAGAALERASLHEEAAAAFSLADDVDPLVRRAAGNSNARPDIRELSASADRSIRKHFTSLHRLAIDLLERETGDDLSRVLHAIWPLTHDERFEFRTPKQEPVIFYMPDLPPATVTPNELLPWAGRLEAAWRDILAEYDAAVQSNIAMTPYVPARARDAKWSRLRGREDWSSVHLYKDAQKTAYTDKFPRTVEALSAVDLVSIDGTPLEAFFSRLRPGAHIPPHYGLTNSRLTVHLPLIVPEHCGIRVGDDMCGWEEGKIIAFDDSFEHEAWNKSESDRVVLIFEAPHPDLSEAERRAVEHAYSVRQNWLRNRRRLLEATVSMLQ